jgi:ABC-type dipeptide/oligopeptide/nickel transport system permease component
MIIIILLIIFAISFAMFPATNSVIMGINTTGWGTILQAEHVVLPFLFLGAVLIALWVMRRRQG